MGNKPPASLIVEELDLNNSQDLDENELRPMLDVMAKMPRLSKAVCDAKDMIREAEEHSKNKDGRLDVDELKAWFNMKKFDKATQQAILEGIRAASSKSSDFSVGMRIDVKDGQTWRTAEITRVKGTLIKIHYEGWSSHYDEAFDVVRAKNKWARLGEMTKGAWTGRGPCPFYEFDSKTQAFVEAEIKMSAIYERVSGSDAKLTDPDIEFLLATEGKTWVVNSLRAKPKVLEDVPVPAAFLSKFLKLATYVIKTQCWPADSKYPDAPRAVLQQTLMTMMGREGMNVYFKNYQDGNLLKCTKVYAVKKKNFAVSQINLVNQFGNDGGFEALGKRIASLREKKRPGDAKSGSAIEAGFVVVNDVISLIAHLKPVLEPSFFKEYVKNMDLETLVQTALGSLNDNDLRGLKEQVFRSIGGNIASLLEYTGHRNPKRVKETIQLDVAERLLRVDQLPRKVAALRSLGDIIRSLEADEKKSMLSGFSNLTSWIFGGGGRKPAGQRERPIQKLDYITQGIFIDWLDSKKVVETVLKPGTHEQVIRASVPILKYLASKGKLTTKHLDTLTGMLSGADAETATLISSSVAELAERLPEKYLKNLFKNCKKALGDYTAADLKFISNFTQSAVKATKGRNNKFGLEVLWDLVQAKNQGVVDAEIALQARRCLRDLFACDEIEEHYAFYTRACCKNLSAGNSVVVSLEMLQMLLESPDQKTTNRNITRAVKSYDVLTALVREFRAYMRVASEALDKADAKADDAKAADENTADKLQTRVLAGTAPHDQQVKARLRFAKFILQNSDSLMSLEQLDELWDACVTESLCAFDIAAFMEWLSDCMMNKVEPLNKWRPKTKRDVRKVFAALDRKSNESIFAKLSKKYVNSRTQQPIRVTADWYACFASCFKAKNIAAGAMTTGGYLADFENLTGTQALWDFALREPLKSVREQAQKFLVGIHIKLETKLADKDKIIALKNFLDTCVAQLGAKQEQKSESSGPVSTCKAALVVLSQLIERIDAGEMFQRPLFKVGEQVMASWKAPWTDTGNKYNAEVKAFNSDDKTYHLKYSDGDVDRRAKEDNIRTRDGKKKIRPTPVLTKAEKFPKEFLCYGEGTSDRFFEAIVRLLGQDDSDVAARAWALLQNLPHNGKVRDSMCKLQEPADKLLPTTPSRLLCRLAVVDPATVYKNSENPLNQPDWCSRFFKKGALAALVARIAKDIKKSFDAKPTAVVLRCLSRALNLLGFFMVASQGQIALNPEQVAEQIEIPKLMTTCLSYLPGLARSSEPAAISSVLSTIMICTRLQPELVANVAKAIDWDATIGAALIDNESTMSQAAFTRGLASICRDSVDLPVFSREVKGEGKGSDSKSADAQTDAGEADPASEEQRRGSKAKTNSVEIDFKLDVSRLFIALDADKSRDLDAKELQALFSTGKPFPPGVADEVSALIEAADTAKSGKISFSELDAYFKLKNLTSVDLDVTYRRLNTYRRVQDAKRSNAKKLREDLRRGFLPILLKRFSGLDTSRPCAQYLMLMSLLIGQTETIEKKEAKRIASSLAELIRRHPVTEKNVETEDTVLGALMRLSGETIKKANFLKASLGVESGGGTASAKQSSLLRYVIDCLFDIPSQNVTAGVQPPKCKHQRSREAAFGLLKSLVEGNEKNLREVVDRLTPNHLQIHSAGSRPDVWEYEPPSQVAERSSYCGLYNCGNTCFINAALQQLFMMKEMRKNLLGVTVNTQTDAKQDSNQKIASNLLLNFQWLMSRLQESSDYAVRPMQFLNSFIDPATQSPVRGNGSKCQGRQDDSLAFLQVLLSKLEDGVKDAGYQGMMQRELGTGICTELIGRKETPYLSDHEAKHRNSVSTNIVVEVNGCSTLQDCLERFVKGDEVEIRIDAPGVYGQMYPRDKRIKVLKRLSFKTLPNTLLIGLKRMELSWDDRSNNMVTRKLIHPVEYPMDLDMRPFCIQSLSIPKGYASGDPAEAKAAEGKGGADSKNGEGGDEESPDGPGDEEADAPPKPTLRRIKSFQSHPDSYYQYQLMGVIVHSGRTLNSGHYYSFIRERPEKSTQPKPNEKGGRWFCFNDSSVSSFDPANLGAETFGATDGSWKSATAYVLVYERRERVDDIAAETESGSTNPMLQKIWEENRTKWKDTNVYNLPYFRFMTDLLQDFIKANPDPPTCDVASVSDKPSSTYDASSRLFVRFLVKTLARCRFRTMFWRSWADGASTLLQGNVATSVWFLSMLVNPSTDWMKELLTCPIDEVRTVAAKLFLAAAQTLAQIEGDALVAAVNNAKADAEAKAKAGADAKGAAETDAKVDSKDGDETKARPESKAKADAKVPTKEIVAPERGFVVESLDRFASLLREAKGTSAKQLIETLATVASLGGHVVSYLTQIPDVRRHLMSALNEGDRSPQKIADHYFELLCVLKQDLNDTEIGSLFGGFLPRLLLEAYTSRRAKAINELLTTLCADQAAGEARSAAVVSTLREGFASQPYQRTRPYFRVITALVGIKDVLQPMRVDGCMSAVMDSFAAASFKKKDFLVDMLLRIARANAACAKWLSDAKNNAYVQRAAAFFSAVSEGSGDVDCKTVVMDSRDKPAVPYHMVKVNTISGLGDPEVGVCYTTSSTFAPHSISLADKIKQLKGAIKGESVFVNEDSGYDSDDQRSARTPEDFKAGRLVDVLDTRQSWLLGEVVKTSAGAVQIHYVSYESKWDEWISMDSARISFRAETFSNLRRVFREANSARKETTLAIISRLYAGKKKP